MLCFMDYDLILYKWTSSNCGVSLISILTQKLISFILDLRLATCHFDLSQMIKLVAKKPILFVKQISDFYQSYPTYKKQNGA